MWVWRLVWSNIKICAKEESDPAFKMAITIFSFVTYFDLFLVMYKTLYIRKHVSISVLNGKPVVVKGK